MISLLPFLTQAPMPNPNAGVANALQGFGQLQHRQTFEEQLRQQNEQFQQTFGRLERENQQKAFESGREFDERQRLDQAKAMGAADALEAADPDGIGGQLADQMRQNYGIRQEKAPNYTDPNSPDWQYMPPVMPGATSPGAAAQEAEQLRIFPKGQPGQEAPAEQPPAPATDEDAALAELEKLQRERDLAETKMDQEDAATTQLEPPSEEDKKLAAELPGPDETPPAIRMPGESMPMFAARATAPQQPAPIRYRDAQTGAVYERNPQRQAQINRGRTEGMAAGIGENLIPPKDRAWVAAELKAEVERGALRTPEELRKWFVEGILPRLQGEQRIEAAKANAARPRVGGQRTPVLDFDAGVRHAAKYLDDPGVKKSVAAYPEVNRLLTLAVKNPNSVQDSVLQRTFAKSLNSGALSEADARSPEAYMSWADRARAWEARHFEGQLSPDEKMQMIEVLTNQRNRIEEEMRSAYEAEMDAAENALPESGGYRKGFVSGMTRTFGAFPFFERDRVNRVAGLVAPSGAGPRQPAGKSAPAAPVTHTPVSAQKEAEDLLGGG